MDTNFQILDIQTENEFLSRDIPFFRDKFFHELDAAHAECFKTRSFSIREIFAVSTGKLVILSRRLSAIEYQLLFFFLFTESEFSGRKIWVITDLCVPKSQRQQRIASTYLTQFLQFPGMVAKTIYLWTDQTTKSWQVAYRLYQRLGFRKVHDMNLYNHFQLDPSKQVLMVLDRSLSPAQVLDFKVTPNLYRKIFIDEHILTNMYITRCRQSVWLGTALGFIAPVDAKENRLFVYQSFTSITHVLPNVIYFFVGEGDAFTAKVFETIKDTIALKPDFILFCVDSHFYEVYFVHHQERDQQVSRRHQELTNLILLAPLQDEFTILRDDRGYANAIVRHLPMCVYNMSTRSVEIDILNQVPDFQTVIYQTLPQVVSQPSLTIVPQPVRNISCIPTADLLRKLNK